LSILLIQLRIAPQNPKTPPLKSLFQKLSRIPIAKISIIKDILPQIHSLYRTLSFFTHDLLLDSFLESI